MSGQTNTYHDSGLNLEQAYYYSLLLLIKADSFTYAITNKNQLMAYEAGCELSELAEHTRLHDILAAPYKNTVIGLPTKSFTLVPSAIFNEKHIGDYARLLDVKSDEKVLAQELDEKNYLVYKVEEQLLAKVSRFGLIHVAFAGKGWINAVADSSPQNKQLYINIEKDKIEILNYQDSAIRFYNSFDYKDVADVAYYAALVSTELGLQPHAVQLVLSGNISTGDSIFNTLTGFFEEVTLSKTNILELPEQLHSHQILKLAALSLCESSAAV